MMLKFETREVFRQWLESHQLDDEGVWLIFGKKSGPETLSPDEALEEALCFGWIDGLIKKVDDYTYMKYFKKRLKKSKWSERNRHFALKLIKDGKMTASGLKAIEDAKQDGTWIVEEIEMKAENIVDLLDMLDAYPLAKKNFSNMSPSVQRTYTKFYLSAKREETRNKRFLELVRRFEKNLKPMEQDS